MVPERVGGKYKQYCSSAHIHTSSYNHNLLPSLAHKTHTILPLNMFDSANLHSHAIVTCYKRWQAEKQVAARLCNYDLIINVRELRNHGDVCPVGQREE